jgi:hypothetical protein
MASQSRKRRSSSRLTLDWVGPTWTWADFAYWRSQRRPLCTSIIYPPRSR